MAALHRKELPIPSLPSLAIPPSDFEQFRGDFPFNGFPLDRSPMASPSMAIPGHVPWTAMHQLPLPPFGGGIGYPPSPTAKGFNVHSTPHSVCPSNGRAIHCETDMVSEDSSTNDCSSASISTAQSTDYNVMPSAVPLPAISSLSSSTTTNAMGRDNAFYANIHNIHSLGALPTVPLIPPHPDFAALYSSEFAMGSTDDVMFGDLSGMNAMNGIHGIDELDRFEHCYPIKDELPSMSTSNVDAEAFGKTEQFGHYEVAQDALSGIPPSMPLITSIPPMTPTSSSTSSKPRSKRTKSSNSSKASKSGRGSKAKKLHFCRECDKSFKYKSHLDRHSASHSTSKPFECGLCGKAFGHRYYLQDHIRYNHIKDGAKDRKHRCTECSKTFRLKINLTNHLRIHSGEKPFECGNCGKAFTQKGNCDAHYRACIGIKPFECSVCDKSFTRKMYLQQHLRTHSGEKPFRCTVCDKAFAIKSNMVKHQRARHRDA